MLEDDARAALEQSGIARRYHGMTLRDNEKMMEFIESQRMGPVITGERGLVLVGLNTARTAAILLGRWFVLSDRAVKVLSLGQLSRLLYTDSPDDEDEIEYLRGSEVVVLLDMQHDKDCPITPRAKSEVVDYLRRFRDQGNVLIMHAEHQNLQEWWSGSFVTYVREEFDALTMAKARVNVHG